MKTKAPYEALTGPDETRPAGDAPRWQSPSIEPNAATDGYHGTEATSSPLLNEARKASPNQQKAPWIAASLAWLKDMTLFKALLIVYCLNIVAWGGMIFLLMCNAAPAMCHPTCDDINSPRRIWIEIDSQILNALFCVMAFGLAPRRFLEAWRLCRYWLWKDRAALRQLEGAYGTWFRSPSGDIEAPPVGISPSLSLGALNAPAANEHSTEYIPKAPAMVGRAGPTPLWKLAAVIGLNAMNTVFQAVLSGFMWGYNRHDRPGWSVPFFLCLAFACSTTAGVLGFLEGRKVKKIEGESS